MVKDCSGPEAAPDIRPLQVMSSKSGCCCCRCGEVYSVRIKCGVCGVNFELRVFSQSNTRTQEEILAFFASHVHAVKNIYSRTRFQTYDGRSRYVGVDFVVQRSSVSWLICSRVVGNGVLCLLYRLFLKGVYIDPLRSIQQLLGVCRFSLCFTINSFM